MGRFYCCWKDIFGEEKMTIFEKLGVVLMLASIQNKLAGNETTAVVSFIIGGLMLMLSGEKE